MQEPHLLFHVSVANDRGRRQAVEQVPVTTLESLPCELVSLDGTTMRCPAPPVELNDSTPIQVGFGLLMDGVVSIQNLNRSLLVYPNPSFRELVGKTSFELGTPITITMEVQIHMQHIFHMRTCITCTYTILSKAYMYVHSFERLFLDTLNVYACAKICIKIVLTLKYVKKSISLSYNYI